MNKFLNKIFLSLSIVSLFVSYSKIEKKSEKEFLDEKIIEMIEEEKKLSLDESNSIISISDLYASLTLVFYDKEKLKNLKNLSFSETYKFYEEISEQINYHFCLANLFYSTKHNCVHSKLSQKENKNFFAKKFRKNEKNKISNNKIKIKSKDPSFLEKDFIFLGTYYFLNFEEDFKLTFKKINREIENNFHLENLKNIEYLTIILNFLLIDDNSLNFITEIIKLSESSKSDDIYSYFKKYDHSFLTKKIKKTKKLINNKESQFYNCVKHINCEIFERQIRFSKNYPEIEKKIKDSSKNKKFEEFDDFLFKKFKKIDRLKKDFAYINNPKNVKKELLLFFLPDDSFYKSIENCLEDITNEFRKYVNNYAIKKREIIVKKKLTTEFDTLKKTKKIVTKNDFKKFGKLKEKIESYRPVNFLKKIWNFIEEKREFYTKKNCFSKTFFIVAHVFYWKFFNYLNHLPTTTQIILLSRLLFVSLLFTLLQYSFSLIINNLKTSFLILGSLFIYKIIN